MEHFDVIVLGTGGVGSAAAFHLARRGLKTLAVDRFPGGHDRGSSHGETRVIRQAYFEHADYVPLLLRAYERWSELEALTGQTLLHQVGLLQVGPPQGEVVGGVLASARQHRLEVEELTAEQTTKRFPAFRVPPGMIGVFEPRAGYLRVEKCVLAHLTAAVSAGAEVRAGVEVQHWQPTKQGVEVVTNRGTFAAEKLVIAAGPWATSLLGELNLPLRVLRKHVYWFENRGEEARAEQGCPTYLFELPTGVFYGFPQCDPLGVKMGEHTGGEVVHDVLGDPRELDAADLARVDGFRQACLPAVAGVVKRRSVCYYTMSPDGHFYVDQVLRQPNIAFAAGLSGHGFKFVGVLGEALADLVTDGKTPLPIEFLGMGR